MEQYTIKSVAKSQAVTVTLPRKQEDRGVFLENRVQQLTSVVETQQRQIKRMEAELQELRQFMITSNKR